MKLRNQNRNVIILLVLMMVLLPAQVTLGQVAGADTEEVVILPVQSKKELVVGNKEEATTVTDKTKSEDNGTDWDSSTTMWVGIGVGTVALVVGAVALGGGGSTPAPIVPPIADSLVGAWHAEGRQPGSGRTYSGTYHLYAGGNLGYDINRSDGEHLVGGGSWRINEYQLEVRTDHGSLYNGSFLPAATYVTIDMSSSNGWNLTLTR